MPNVFVLKGDKPPLKGVVQRLLARRACVWGGLGGIVVGRMRVEGVMAARTVNKQFPVMSFRH